MNSEDFKCNTCGDYVGEDGVWGLCDPCFDKEGGNEQLGKSLTIHNNSEFDRTDVEVKRTMRKYFLKHATEDVSVTYSGAEVKDLDDLLSSWEGEIDYVHVPVKTSPVKAHEPFAPRHMQYAVEIVKPRVFDPPMKIKIVKAILSKQTPPKGTT
jgi:hypothetical protein